jgi:hypothetical protein
MNVHERELDYDIKPLKCDVDNVRNSKDDYDDLPVIKTDNYHGLKDVKGQGGLTLLHQSEHFEGFQFEYTFKEFKTDFLENAIIFSWDEEFNNVLDLEPENEDIKNYYSYLSIDDYIFFILRKQSNTITTSYEANVILKRDQYDIEYDIYDMVILNAMPFMFKERVFQYSSIVKMVINLLKITLKYVKNLFRKNNEQEITLRNNNEQEITLRNNNEQEITLRNNNEQEITLRSKNEFKKPKEKEKNNYEAYISSKINSIEKDIAQLEKNLDDLKNHIKGKPRCNEKNTICFSLLKICVPLIIMFGFSEFQVRVQVKKDYY